MFADVMKALTLARVRLFTAPNVCVGGGGPTDPLPPRTRSALMEVELRIKNERVALNERKPIVPNFKVSDGKPMTLVNDGKPI